MNPHELAEKMVLLSAEYSSASAELGKLKAQKAVKWLIARKDAKTDKEATMIYESSLEGQKETILTYKCKGLEKEISALKTQLRLLDSEARGIF